MALVRAASGHRLGPYELGERLGAGGMAEVYVARRAGPRGFAKRFAIKRILPQLSRDPRFVAMFCDEARICAALAHPNIVQVVDFGEHDGELFMAMEYVEGLSCARLLRVVAGRGEKFPLGAALFIAHEVLRALDFAHGARDEHGRSLHIVHRDVSPGNVLIGRAGEVKLTDFGIVRSAFIDRRTYPGELKGKLGYMAPEQAVGGEVDPRCDIFAVGIVLAEMLMVRPLFSGKNEMEMLSRIYEADISALDPFLPTLPEALADALQRSLAREPSERFASAREFADALREVAQAQGEALTDSALLPWLSSMGVLPSSSGTREATRHSDPSDIARAARRVAARARSLPPGVLTAPTVAADHDPGGPIYAVGEESESLMRLPEVLARVATGRLEPFVQVSRGGAPPVAARDVDEISRLASRVAFHFSSALGERVLPLSRADLPAQLVGLARRRATGLLVLRDDARQKRVFWRDGTPYFVASTDPRELLGARLRKAGLVEAEDLDRTLVLASRGGAAHLGEMLVRRGMLRPSELLRALVDQLEARLLEIGNWRRGSLAFHAGVESEDEVPPSRRTPYELTSALVRQGYAEDELCELLAPCWRSPIARNPAVGFGPGELGLTPPELSALRAAPGATSLRRLVDELVSKGFASREEALRALFIGLSSGVVVAPGWALPPALDRPSAR